MLRFSLLVHQGPYQEKKFQQLTSSISFAYGISLQFGLRTNSVRSLLGLINCSCHLNIAPYV
jgi:hypothetical protein